MASTSWTSPGTLSSETRTSSDGGWTNPSNAGAQDDTDATITGVSKNGGFTDYLRAVNFGFAIPTGATIDAVRVRYDAHRGAVGTVTDDDVFIIKAGSQHGTDAAAAGDIGSTDTDTYITRTFTGWTLTETDVEASTFGCEISFINNGTSFNADINVDHIEMQIDYTEVTPTVTDVNTDEVIFDGELNVVIAGTDFGGTTGKVYLSETSTLGGVGTYVQLHVDSWSDTSIQVDIAEITTLNPITDDLELFRTHYIIVEDSGTTQGTGFAVTVTTEEHAALNANATLVTGTTYIILARVQITDSVETSANYRWSYNHMSGGETPITAASSNVQAIATAAYLNDDDISEILTGTGSYLTDNNAGSEDGTFTTGSTPAAGESFVAALAFQIVHADVNDLDTGTITLESGDGVRFDTYTQTFTYTVDKTVAGHTGTGAMTVGGNTLNATGSHDHEGTAAMTSGGLTMVGTGSHDHEGTGAMTVGGNVLLASALQEHIASGAMTVGGNTYAATATQDHQGTGVMVVGGNTYAAPGSHDHEGTGAMTLGPVTYTGQALQDHIGTGTATFDKLSMTSTGQHGNDVTSTGTVTFQKLSLAASGDGQAPPLRVTVALVSSLTSPLVSLLRNGDD